MQANPRQIVGSSSWAEALRQQIASVARRPSTVLITGPSGTGKELVARAIHEQSDRAAKPFIPIDCASVTGTLFASHMFGHVKGAFTGATSDTLGCFRAAEGGTVFLDEIGDMELGLQAKLLRVLQERVVVPVGTHKETPVDVRLLAATNADLGRAVQEGRFREDLYYRLAVVSIATQPLAARPEDIPVIADHILQRLSQRQGVPRKSLSPDALAFLLSHSWPGNVRELENALENAAYGSESTLLGKHDFAGLIHFITPPGQTAPVSSESPSPTNDTPQPAPSAAAAPGSASTNRLAATSDSWVTLNELERRHIQASLEQTGYNQTAAAKLLGVPRSVLYRRIAKHGIVIPGRANRSQS